MTTIAGRFVIEIGDDPYCWWRTVSAISVPMIRTSQKFSSSRSGPGHIPLPIHRSGRTSRQRTMSRARCLMDELLGRTIAWLRCYVALTATATDGIS